MRSFCLNSTQSESKFQFMQFESKLYVARLQVALRGSGVLASIGGAAAELVWRKQLTCKKEANYFF